MALVDNDTIQVEGYFGETKLPRIRIGDSARTRLMGKPPRSQGASKASPAALRTGKGAPEQISSPTSTRPFVGSTCATRPNRIVLDHVAILPSRPAVPSAQSAVLHRHFAMPDLNGNTAEHQFLRVGGIVTAIRACSRAGGSLAKAMTKISYGGYRFPPEIIQHAIWLYFRFTLSFRDVAIYWPNAGLSSPTRRSGC